MKSIFIAFDQAHRDKIVDMLERSNCRGFTAWEQVTGRGSVDGEPHYGTRGRRSREPSSPWWKTTAWQ